MKNFIIFALIFSLAQHVEAAEGNKPVGSFRVMSMNTWHSGTHLDDGRTKIAQNVMKINPDIVIFQEMYADAMKAIFDMIPAAYGYKYVYHGNGIMTKHQSFGLGYYLSMGVSVRIPHLDLLVHLVDFHLNWLVNATLILVEDNGKTDEQRIAEVREGDVNSKGDGRLQEMQQIVTNPEFRRCYTEVKDGKKRAAMIIGGDFNEPSHRDWVEATSHLHAGKVYEWPVTKLLEKIGFVDSYRQVHPDPLAHPGITWSVCEKGPKEIQDRIDFLFYTGGLIRAINSFTFAGNETMNRPTPNHQHNDWPSDHYAVVTDFEVY